MAMMITLRDKTNADVLTMDINPLVPDPKAYPEIVNFEAKSYVIKQVSRDKKTALYVEGNILEIQGEA